MKAIINILGFLFPVIMYAQNTINTVGGSANMSNATFEWSIGETTVIKTNTSANIHVTHGVLQPVRVTFLGCTTLINPHNGATEVSVNTSIDWNAISGVTGYRLTIGTSPDGTNIQNSLDVGNVTSYTPTIPFPENTTIYVRLIPYNTIREAEECLEESFTTGKLIELIIPKGFSPNEDGIHDFWEIKGIENYPQNAVSIYNRWGDKVFDINKYNNSSNVFKGRANKLNKIGAKELPSGTYFYMINYKRNTSGWKSLKGFVVIKR